jgi:hypothetical protein
MNKGLCLLLVVTISSLLASSREIYIDSKKGDDKSSGSQSQPLKTIGEAANRINADATTEATTIFLAEGVYVLIETATFRSDRFSEGNRLTIRAEVLPDDADWNPQRMPIITAVIAGTLTPGDGEESRGLEIETNHVTIEGLHFTGSPGLLLHRWQTKQALLSNLAGWKKFERPCRNTVPVCRKCRCDADSRGGNR